MTAHAGRAPRSPRSLAGRSPRRIARREDELFGAPAAPSPLPRRPRRTGPRAPAEAPARERPRPAATSPRPEEAELFGAAGSPAALPAAAGAARRPRERGRPLHVGGQVYLPADDAWQEDVHPRDWHLTSPNLVDLYLDARPNDRVRAFVLGRLSTTRPSAPPPPRVQSASPPSRGVSAHAALANPRGVLDQLWVNFDVGRRGFVTAGQAAREVGRRGASGTRPTTCTRVTRDPLAIFDARTGTTMAEGARPLGGARAGTSTASAMLEDVSGRRRSPPTRLGRVAAGGRAEAGARHRRAGARRARQDGTSRASAWTSRPASGSSTSTPRRRSASAWTCRAGARRTRRRTRCGRFGRDDPAGLHAAGRAGRELDRRTTPTRTRSPSARSTSSTTPATTTRASTRCSSAVPVAGPLLGRPGALRAAALHAVLPGPALRRRFAPLPSPGAGTTPPSRCRCSATSPTRASWPGSITRCWRSPTCGSRPTWPATSARGRRVPARFRRPAPAVGGGLSTPSSPCRRRCRGRRGAAGRLAGSTSGRGVRERVDRPRDCSPPCAPCPARVGARRTATGASAPTLKGATSTWRIGMKKNTGLTFDQALERIPELLKAEGFGDPHADRREGDPEGEARPRLQALPDPRRLQPALAHQALSQLPEVGVHAALQRHGVGGRRRQGGRERHRPAADLAAAQPGLAPIAAQVRARLARVLEQL